MALNEIRSRIIESGAGHLLDSLPPIEFLKWMHLPAASPSTALVLGTVDEKDILAYPLKFGEKPREVRYCSIPANRPAWDYHIEPLLQDEVVRLPLDAPFKYNADTSKNGKRRFTMVIKWYFLEKGLLEGYFGDYADYSKRFGGALRLVDEGQQAEKSSGRDLRSQRVPVESTLSEGGEEANELDEPRRLRSGDGEHDRNRHGFRDQETGITRQVKPTNVPQLESVPSSTPNGRNPLSNGRKEENQDVVTLREFLNSYGELHLLENIPEADQMQFADQDFISSALPKKLFVGHMKRNRDEIYAYMRPSRNHHEINFYYEDSKGSNHLISADEVAKQHIYHPFNKTYPADASELDQSDKARLSLIIKWYYLASGVAHNIVLKETKAYPPRFRYALEYVARRMDCLQSSLSLTTGRTRTTQAPSAAPLPNTTAPQPTTSTQPAPSPDTHHNTNQPPTSPHPSKRTAEDAGFEGLARIVTEDQDLTKQINDSDQTLEMLDMRVQNFEEGLEAKIKQFMDGIDAQRKQFMTNWTAQKDEEMEKRNELNRKRGDLRKKFKRESLTVGSWMDD